MNRSKLLAIFFSVSALSAEFLVASQSLSSVDATMQPSPPVRGQGPFPGSTSPGHSDGLPIRLELVVPNGELRRDGSLLVDFVITNVGTEPINLPSSVNQNIEHMSVLTLWLTSDAIMDQFAKDQQTGRPFRIDIVGTSAELYGRNNDPQNFAVLAPNKSILVHASSRIQLNPGSHSITAHAELLRIMNGTSRLVGTADSEAVTKTLSKPKPSPR
jgi:hypothetical protein